MNQALIDSAWNAVIKPQPNSELEEETKVPISQFFYIIHELEQLCSGQPATTTTGESKTLPLGPSLLSASAVELMERLIHQNRTKRISKFQFSEILSDLLSEESCSSSTSPAAWAQRQQQQSKRRSISLCTHPNPTAPAAPQQQQQRKDPIPAPCPTPDHQKTILTRQLSTYAHQLQQLQANETRRLHHIEAIEHELDDVQTELVLRRQQQNAEFTSTQAAVQVANAQAAQEEQEALSQALFASELGVWDDIKNRLNQLEEEKNEYLTALAAMTAECSGYLLVIDSLNQQACSLRGEINQLKCVSKSDSSKSSSGSTATGGSSTKANLLLAAKPPNGTDFFANLVTGEFTPCSSYFSLAMIVACVVGLFLPLFFVATATTTATTTAGGIYHHSWLV